MEISNVALKRYTAGKGECMLVGVDFEGEMFRLAPFDTDWYEDRTYWVHYKFVDKPRRKPKMEIIYGGGCCEK